MNFSNLYAFVVLPALVLELGLVSGCSSSRIMPEADGIETALLHRKEDFRTCYESELSRAPRRKLEGKLVALFQIDSNGNVSDAAVKSTTLNNPKVETCIIRTIQSIRFPALKDGGKLEVSYPFRFSSA